MTNKELLVTDIIHLQLIDVDVIGALDMYVEQGQWDRCIQEAEQQVTFYVTVFVFVPHPIKQARGNLKINNELGKARAIPPCMQQDGYLKISLSRVFSNLSSDTGSKVAHSMKFLFQYGCSPFSPRTAPSAERIFSDPIVLRDKRISEI